MEWVGFKSILISTNNTIALGLMVTLVWLYIELLRLLAKLQERRCFSLTD